MATLTVYNGQSGYLQHLISAGTSTYSDLRGGAGNGGDFAYYIVPHFRAHTTTNYYDRMLRGFAVYDTGTGLPDTCTISAVELHAMPESKMTALGSTAYNWTSFSPANPDSIAEGDYDSFGSTRFLDSDVTSASLTVGSWYTFTFNSSGRAAISKTGKTCLMVRDAWDLNNSFTGSWSSAGATGVFFYYASGTNQSYLYITYTTETTTQKSISVTETTSVSLTANGISGSTLSAAQHESHIDISWT